MYVLVIQTDDSAAIVMLNHLLDTRYRIRATWESGGMYSLIIPVELFADVKVQAESFGLSIYHGDEYKTQQDIREHDAFSI